MRIRRLHTRSSPRRSEGISVISVVFFMLILTRSLTGQCFIARHKSHATLSLIILSHSLFCYDYSLLFDFGVQFTPHFSLQIEAIIFEPSKINVKVASELVEICFTPIIQSGGKYDIKVNAESNSDNLSSDIIICSLGARYKNYCANVSRTFIVDAPPKVEKTYAVLMGLYDACLDQMVPGHELKDVVEAAKAYLTKK